MSAALLLPLAPPPPDRAEILRYARAAGDAATEALLDELLPLALSALTYRVAYRRLAVSHGEGGCRVAGLSRPLPGGNARLGGCREVLLLGATVGHALDRLILRYGHTSPVRALFLSAIGTERVEALLDTMCREGASSLGLTLLPRFSPGYGEVPLSLQREVLPLLDSERLLGITLGEGLLMSPSKSVTAFAGILP